MHQKLLSPLLVGAFLFGIVPGAHAEDTSTSDTRSTTITSLEQCESFTRFRKIRCTRRYHRTQIREKCSSLEGEEKRACKKEYFEENEISKPVRKLHRRINHSVRSQCKDIEDREEKRVCYKEARSNAVQKARRWWKSNHPLTDEQKEELKACRELEIRQEKRECRRNVLSSQDS